MCALLDTGSSVSLVDERWVFTHSGHCKLPELSNKIEYCQLANSEQMQILGTIKIKIRIGEFTWKFTVKVARNLSVPAILGADFIEKTGLVPQWSQRKFYFEFAREKPYKFCKHRVHRQIKSSRQVVNAVEKVSVYDLDHLSPEQRQQILELCTEFSEVLTDRLGEVKDAEYKIELTDNIPVKCPPYRLSPPRMKALRVAIREMLHDGVIRPSKSPYSSPIFVVAKPQGGVRPVVDYRALNKKIVLQSIPLPDLHSCFSWFYKAKFFTTFDLNQAYYQIPLAEESKPVTAFATDWSLYEYNRVPFGLSTGAAVLSGILDRVFSDLKFEFVYHYLDDLVIFSESFEEHIVHVREVLQRLRKAGFTVKPSKVKFAQPEISFLGHIVSQNGVRIDQSRTQAVYSFAIPKNVKAVARFVGMINFFRKYIPNFAQLAAPLNELRKKDRKFEWGPSQQSSFEALKKALATAPVLAMADFNKEFIVQTDASMSGVAAVLLQEGESGRRPIAYASRCLSPVEAKYSVYELEALAVLFALEKFKLYLEHQPFLLETDNQALSWVLARPRRTGRIARWAVRISAFHFKVKHIRGSENVVADSLSRMFESEPKEQEDEEGGLGETSDQTKCSCAVLSKEVGLQQLSDHSCAILSGLPLLFKDVALHQDEDPELSKIKERIRGGEKVRPYCLRGNVLCYVTRGKGSPKVLLPQALVSLVFRYYHETPVGGHLGVFKTRLKIKEHFTWKGIDKQIKQMVSECKTCGFSKPVGSAQQGFLSSEEAREPMERLYCDYVGPLPRSKEGNRYIFVCVDAFTRFCWLTPTRNITSQVSIRCLQNIFGVFGPCRTLVTDNATSFKSTAFRNFCFEAGVAHTTTTPYYPNPSMAERVNRNLRAALIAFHHNDQTRWDNSLSWLGYAFNTATHEAHKATPVSLMFAFKPNSPLANLWQLSDLLPERVDGAQIRANWKRAQKNLRKSHEQRERRYNAGRRPISLKTGDQVWVKNFGAVSRAADKVTGKLLPRFVGPVEILRFVTPVTLLVRNPQSKRIFRVHVSQVKPYAKTVVTK